MHGACGVLPGVREQWLGQEHEFKPSHCEIYFPLLHCSVWWRLVVEELMAETRLRTDFHSRLKQARIEAGLSVTDLAKRITSTRGEVNPQTGRRRSIGASTVRAYESQAADASIPIVKQLAGVLDKSMSYFCEGLDETEPGVAPSNQATQISELQADVKRLKIDHLDLLGKYIQLAKELEILKGGS